MNLYIVNIEHNRVFEGYGLEFLRFYNQLIYL